MWRTAQSSWRLCCKKQIFLRVGDFFFWGDTLLSGSLTQEGGLLLDATANHFYFFARRRGWNHELTYLLPKRKCLWLFDIFAQPLADIPDDIECNEGTNRRRGKDPDDVMVCVKEYISSPEFRQQPMLVLTPDNQARFTLVTNRRSDLHFVECFLGLLWYVLCFGWY